MGCFKYSPVEGARANRLPDPVPEEVKEERFGRFMRLQAGISAARLQDRIGRRQDVLVDAVEGNTAVGRTAMEAPEIDGVVYLRDAPDLNPGDIVPAVIEDTDDHDLWARPVGRA